MAISSDLAGKFRARLGVYCGGRDDSISIACGIKTRGHDANLTTERSCSAVAEGMDP
jgi:hypothetical protein